MDYFFHGPASFQIISAVILLAHVLPYVQILPDHGLSQWWALLAVVPLFGLTAVLWLIAFKSYQNQRGAI